MTQTDVGRTAFALFFVGAGTLHFLLPSYYRAVVPSYLPAPALLVAVSGAAEIAGGLGLLIPRLRLAAGAGLILLLLAVFPANVEMLRLARLRPGHPWIEAVLWLRLPLQAVLIWWAWRLARPSRASPRTPRAVP